MLDEFILLEEQTNFSITDHEVALIRQLIALSDFQADRMAIVDFYVSLKSKPMIILVGDSQSDQVGLVRLMIHVLIGDDYLQHQVLTGHPWWVGSRSGSNVLTPIHMRFVTEKILATLEEASDPDHSKKMYIACLSQISPAELDCFFSEVAYQLSHGEIMRIGDAHFSKPLRFPKNTWLIGTIDKPMLYLDDDLLNQAILIQAPVFEMNNSIVLSENDRSQFQAIFLRSYIRDKQMAYHKLQSILFKHGISIQPIFQVFQYLKNYGLSLPSSVLDNCIIYLANSWSLRGQGLFDPVPPRNLDLTLDFAIKNVLLTRAEKQIQSSRNLHCKLNDLLISYPSCFAYLKAY